MRMLLPFVGSSALDKHSCPLIAASQLRHMKQNKGVKPCHGFDLPARILGRACMQTDTSLMLVLMSAPGPCISLSPVCCNVLRASRQLSVQACAESANLPSLQLSRYPAR